MLSISAPSITAAALYFAAGAAIWFRARPRAPINIRLAAIRAAAFVAVGLQGWALYQVIFTARGIDLGFFNSASLVGLEIALTTLIASLRQQVINLGLIIFPLVGLSTLAAWVSPDYLLIPNAGWGLNTHIIVSLSAYSLLAVAAAQAVLLALQDYRLRHRQTRRVIGVLPPLQVMEQFMFHIISAGFALLTLALLSGFLFLDNWFAPGLAEKTTLSIVAWCIFAALLWGRWQFGWRSPTATTWTLGGFVALVFAYFGSKLIFELILGMHHPLV